MITVAPGITALDWSFTVPETVPDPPELAAKTPEGQTAMPNDRIRMRKETRLPNMNFLHVIHEILVASN
jgi:hypothetical protein